MSAEFVVKFEEWANRNYVTLLWRPEGKSALVMELKRGADAAKKERIRLIFAALAEEVG